MDAPVDLGDLISSSDLGELLDAFAAVHHVGLAVADCSGTFTPRDAGDDLRALIAAEPQPGRHGEVRAYQIRELTHDGEPMGHVILGPYRAPSGDGAADSHGQGGSGADATLIPVMSDRAAETLIDHVTVVVGVIVHNSYVRYLTSMVHVASMNESFEELSAKNERLEHAVVRMQELDRLKSGFLATVSHELRTPLTSIIGYTEMLLEGMAGAMASEQRDYVQTILQKAEQLLQLITSVLDASLIEAGKVPLDRAAISVADIADSVVSSFQPQARRSSVTLAFQRCPLPRVLANAHQIRQALWNLLANAVKFTPSGGQIAISMDVGAVRQDDDILRGVRVRVADSGIGIAAEKLVHIFEPFFQVDSSSTREYGGTGLGLTVAKSYVESHGGKLWVESAIGRGSVFTMTLPAIPLELQAWDSEHGGRGGPNNTGDDVRAR